LVSTTCNLYPPAELFRLIALHLEEIKVQLDD